MVVDREVVVPGKFVLGLGYVRGLGGVWLPDTLPLTPGCDLLLPAWEPTLRAALRRPASCIPSKVKFENVSFSLQS